MDLKQKFKVLLNLPSENDPTTCKVSYFGELIGLTEADIKQLNRDPKSYQVNQPNPEAQQEALDSIEAGFVDESCDGGSYLLKKLPEQFDLDLIRKHRHLLGLQLSAITNRLYALILQNQSECAKELQNVLVLQDELDMACGFCSSGHLQIKRAKNKLTMSSLGLLARYRQRQNLQNIVKSLKTVRTLAKLSIRVQELFAEQNYSAAIQLLVEGKNVAENYKHFNCVAQLSVRLQETIEMAEEQLDNGLSKSCQNFDPVLYKQLLLAFVSIGKQPSVLWDQLNLHMVSRLHKETLVVIKKYAKPDEEEVSLLDLNKMQFQDLSKYVHVESYASCLLELCTCLWNITTVYHQIHDWHTNQKSDDKINSLELTDEVFQHGKNRLWQDGQNKIRVFLLSCDFWHFTIGQFLRVLNLVDKLIDVGKDFCDSQSEILHESVRQQSVTYFRNFHRGRLDELRVFLEHESWEHCPLRSDFSVFQLAEFSFLNKKNSKATNGRQIKTNHYSDISVLPFTDIQQNEEDESITEDKGSKESENDDVNGGPLIANTTLSVLRLFGRYIHLMQVLKPIAFDVLICLNQLFDYYLYAVYKFFGTNPAAACDASMSPKFRLVINRIEEMLVFEPKEDEEANQENNQVPCPVFSRSLQIDHPNQMYGLKIRLIAAESVVFLAQQMTLLREHLLVLVPPGKESSLEQFFVQTTSVAQDLRSPVYTSVACRCLDVDQIIAMMNRVQWDVKEVMSQHSAYIDRLLQALNEFNANVYRVCHGKTLPAEAYNILWDQILKLCYRILLDGFASAKKCTNEGRALMQLDLRQFQLKVESITRFRPLPDSSLVEAYIKAFYLPESALEQWVQEHKEYTPRQLAGLLQNVGQANKKNRLNLSSLMEELDLSRR